MFKKASISFKVVCVFLLLIFVSSILIQDLCNNLKQSDASVLHLPEPTQLISVSDNYSQPLLKGLRIDPENPLKIDFILDSADKSSVSQEDASKLIKYFLAGLTVSDDSLWVNLSPYEKDRVIDESLVKTDLGKDMLAQDYLLKQLSSSLTHPDTPIGDAYWKIENRNANYETNSNAEIRNTFNKIWIAPDVAEVFTKDNTVLITKASLKVETEADYLAHNVGAQHAAPGIKESVSADSVRDVLIPEISKDVNNGKNFATLRQVYHSLILAKWFKQNFINSFYNSYINKSKIKGIEHNTKEAKQRIYNLYVEAFNKGVYDLVKKEKDNNSNKLVKRHYFSGGIEVMPKELANSAIFNDKQIDELVLGKTTIVSSKLDLLDHSNVISLYENVDQRKPWARKSEIISTDDLIDESASINIDSDLSDFIDELLDSLSGNEKAVIEFYYGLIPGSDSLTMVDIAKKFSLSRNQVTRLRDGGINKIVRMLKKYPKYENFSTESIAEIIAIFKESKQRNLQNQNSNFILSEEHTGVEFADILAPLPLQNRNFIELYYGLNNTNGKRSSMLDIKYKLGLQIAAVRELKKESIDKTIDILLYPVIGVNDGIGYHEFSQKALSNLSDKERRVFVMSMIDNASGSEIAEILSLMEGKIQEIKKSAIEKILIFIFRQIAQRNISAGYLNKFINTYKLHEKVLEKYFFEYSELQRIINLPEKIDGKANTETKAIEINNSETSDLSNILSKLPEIDRKIVEYFYGLNNKEGKRKSLGAIEIILRISNKQVYSTKKETDTKIVDGLLNSIDKVEDLRTPSQFLNYVLTILSSEEKIILNSLFLHSRTKKEISQEENIPFHKIPQIKSNAINKIIKFLYWHVTARKSSKTNIFYVLKKYKMYQRYIEEYIAAQENKISSAIVSDTYIEDVISNNPDKVRKELGLTAEATKKNSKLERPRAKSSLDYFISLLNEPQYQPLSDKEKLQIRKDLLAAKKRIRKANPEIDKDDKKTMDQKFLLDEEFMSIREKLVYSNFRFVLWVAKFYQDQQHILSLEDLISEGNRGLLMAVNRFEEHESDVKFLSYGVKAIMSHIQLALKNNGYTAAGRLTDGAKKKLVEYKKILSEGNKPNDYLQVQDLRTVIAIIENQNYINLDNYTSPRKKWEYNYEKISTDDLVSNEGLIDTDLDVAKFVDKLVSKLPEDEQEVVQLRYGLVPDADNLTMAEISVRLSKPLSLVKSKLASAVRKMLKNLNDIPKDSNLNYNTLEMAMKIFQNKINYEEDEKSTEAVKNDSYLNYVLNQLPNPNRKVMKAVYDISQEHRIKRTITQVADKIFFSDRRVRQIKTESDRLIVENLLELNTHVNDDFEFAFFAETVLKRLTEEEKTILDLLFVKQISLTKASKKLYIAMHEAKDLRESAVNKIVKVLYMNSIKQTASKDNLLKLISHYNLEERFIEQFMFNRDYFYEKMPFDYLFCNMVDSEINVFKYVYGIIPKKSVNLSMLEKQRFKEFKDSAEKKALSKIFPRSRIKTNDDMPIHFVLNRMDSEDRNIIQGKYDIVSDYHANNYMFELRNESPQVINELLSKALESAVVKIFELTKEERLNDDEAVAIINFLGIKDRVIKQVVSSSITNDNPELALYLRALSKPKHKVLSSADEMQTLDDLLDLRKEYIEKYPGDKKEDVAARDRAMLDDGRFIRIRNKLVNANLKFVVSAVKGWNNPGNIFSYSELINIGNMGLMKAALRYKRKNGKKVKFISYAVWWIRQAVQKEVNETGYTGVTKVPINQSNLIAKMEKLKSEGKDPKKDVKFAKKGTLKNTIIANNVNKVVRLDAINNNEDGNRTNSEYLSSSDFDYDYADSVVDEDINESIYTLLTELTEREEEIICLYYGVNTDGVKYKLEQIGTMMDITRERVRQIKEKAITRLKKLLQIYSSKKKSWSSEEIDTILENFAINQQNVENFTGSSSMEDTKDPYGGIDMDISLSAAKGSSAIEFKNIDIDQDISGISFTILSMRELKSLSEYISV